MITVNTITKYSTYYITSNKLYLILYLKCFKNKNILLKNTKLNINNSLVSGLLINGPIYLN